MAKIPRKYQAVLRDLKAKTGPSEGFFSPLGDAIAQAPFEQAPADQWSSYLQPGRIVERGGVNFRLKKGELQAVDFDNWLKDYVDDFGPGNIAKEELLDVLEAAYPSMRRMLGTRGPLRLPDYSQTTEATLRYPDPYLRTAPMNRPKRDPTGYQEDVSILEGLEYHPGHFSDSTHSWSRTSEHKIPWIKTTEAGPETNWWKVRLIEEIQSDVQQKSREVGFGREPKIDLPDHFITKKAGVGGDAYRYSLWEKKRPLASHDSRKQKPQTHTRVMSGENPEMLINRWILRNYINDDVTPQGRNEAIENLKGYWIGRDGELLPQHNIFDDAEVMKELAEVQGVPNIPYKKTEEMVTLELRKQLYNAAVNGDTHVALVRGEDQIARYPWMRHKPDKGAGTEYAYDKLYPRLLRQVGKPYGAKFDYIDVPVRGDESRGTVLRSYAEDIGMDEGELENWADVGEHFEDIILDNDLDQVRADLMWSIDRFENALGSSTPETRAARDEVDQLVDMSNVPETLENRHTVRTQLEKIVRLFDRMDDQIRDLNPENKMPEVRRYPALELTPEIRKRIIEAGVPAFAKGGKVSRRDVLKGLLGAGAAALGAGKAAQKATPAEALTEISEKIVEPKVIARTNDWEGWERSATGRTADEAMAKLRELLIKSDEFEDPKYVDYAMREHGVTVSDDVEIPRHIDDALVWARPYIHSGRLDEAWKDMQRTNRYPYKQFTQYIEENNLDPDETWAELRKWMEWEAEQADKYDIDSMPAEFEGLSYDEVDELMLNRGDDMMEFGKGGKVRKIQRHRLKEGPKIYEGAMDAIRRGDINTAEELLDQLKAILDIDDDGLSQMLGRTIRHPAESTPVKGPFDEIYDPDAPIGGYVKDNVPEKLAKGGALSKAIRDRVGPTRRLYHVTFTDKVAQIMEEGITPQKVKNWRVGSEDGPAYGGDQEVFSFDNFTDALRWAGKMDWDFYQSTGTGEISIIAHDTFGRWHKDDVDPINQAGALGQWLKRNKPVEPESLTKVIQVDQDLVRKLSQAFPEEVEKPPGMAKGGRPPKRPNVIQAGALFQAKGKDKLDPKILQHMEDVGMPRPENVSNMNEWVPPDERGLDSPLTGEIEAASTEYLPPTPEFNEWYENFQKRLDERIREKESKLQEQVDAGLFGFKPGQEIWSTHSGKKYRILGYDLGKEGDAMYWVESADGNERHKMAEWGMTGKPPEPAEVKRNMDQFLAGEFKPKWASTDEFNTIFDLLLDYTERDEFGEIQIVRDPNRPGVFAAADVDTFDDEFFPGFIIDMNQADPLDAVEEVEFPEWPPRPRRPYAKGGKVAAKKSGARKYLQALGESLFGAIPFAGEEGALIGRDVGEHMYNVGAIPVAGFQTQWYGKDPETGQSVYAGPFSDSDASWGLVDETLALPAFPGMLSMDEEDAIAFEETGEIPWAPAVSERAQARIEANEEQILKQLGIEYPSGLTENALYSAGIMAGQLPVPLSWLNRAKGPLKTARDWWRRSGPKSGKIAAAGSEWFMPWIDPKLKNYAAGTAFGAGLMTGFEALGGTENEMLLDAAYQGDNQAWSMLVQRAREGDPEAQKLIQSVVEAAQTQEYGEGEGGALSRAAWENFETGQVYAKGGRIKRLPKTEPFYDLPNVWHDNPGGGWLEHERLLADEKYTGEPHGRTFGSQTAGIRHGYFDPDFIASLPGLYDEHLLGLVDDDKFRDLMKLIERFGGYDEKYPIFVEVNHRGEPFINEGNHRSRAALEIGMDEVPVEVRYRAGGEGVPGPMRLQELLDSVTVEKAKGGKVNRRDVLKGMLGAGAAALGAGKAANKATDPADLLKTVDEGIKPAVKAAPMESFRGYMGELGRSLAEKIRGQGEEHWGRNTPDFDDEMIEMYAEDAKDYSKIASLMEEGRYEEAAEVYDGLDTAARDYIYELLDPPDLDRYERALELGVGEWEPLGTRERASLSDMEDSLKWIAEAEDGDAQYYQRFQELVQELRDPEIEGTRADEIQEMLIDLDLEVSDAFPDAYAKGGKVTRRDVLKGIGSAAATALAGGKAANKGDPEALLKTLDESIKPASKALSTKELWDITSLHGKNPKRYAEELRKLDIESLKQIEQFIDDRWKELRSSEAFEEAMWDAAGISDDGADYITERNVGLGEEHFKRALTGDIDPTDGEGIWYPLQEIQEERGLDMDWKPFEKVEANEIPKKELTEHPEYERHKTLYDRLSKEWDEVEAEVNAQMREGKTYFDLDETLRDRQEAINDQINDLLYMIEHEGYDVEPWDFAKGGKVSRRDVLKGLLGTVAGALGAGKAVNKADPETLVKGLKAAPIPSRTLSGPFAKEVLSPDERKIFDHAVNKYLETWHTNNAEEVASMGLPNADAEYIKQGNRAIERLEQIMEMPDDQVMTKAQWQEVKDAFDELEMDHTNQSNMLEEQWNLMEDMHKDMWSPPEAVESFRQAGYKSHPDPDPAVKEAFEDIATDGRIWDDRYEYVVEDLMSTYQLNENQATQLYEMIHAGEEIYNDMDPYTWELIRRETEEDWPGYKTYKDIIED